MQEYLGGFELTDQQQSSRMELDEKVERAITILRLHEPAEGYYLAQSGGKDSGTIEALARMAGVKFDSHYNNTTIDPPELVRFIKQYHPEAWVARNEPKHGNMFYRIETANKVPPTRNGRWCCEEYKEYGGAGRVKLVGVRAAESTGRKRRWREVAEDKNGDDVICAIVYWSEDDVWKFIFDNKIPYCWLYDWCCIAENRRICSRFDPRPDKCPDCGGAVERKERLGCVGCPLASKENQQAEFVRWPKYGAKWKKSVIGNWERMKDLPRLDGAPRYHAKFKTGEDFWNWWIQQKSGPHVCQEGLLWTNLE